MLNIFFYLPSRSRLIHFPLAVIQEIRTKWKEQERMCRPLIPSNDINDRLLPYFSPRRLVVTIILFRTTDLFIFPIYGGLYPFTLFN
jgi:hypothetical protein